jgi:arsenate reductase (glutaredoxin)
MTTVRIYHNPRCSKSREALALLEERGLEIETINYLETPIDNATLSALLKELGLSARELMRRKEDVYRELNLDNPELSEAQLVQAMVDYPKLIERPIVHANGKTIVARPPQRIEELFQ